MKTMQHFLYSYICHEEERGLCELEARRMLELKYPFHMEAGLCIAKSDNDVDVNRSPFMKYKMKVWQEAASMEELLQAAAKLDSKGLRFKVHVWETDGLAKQERRELAKQIGSFVTGIADLHEPQLWIGAARWQGRWYIGEMTSSQSNWLKHQDKPRQYSTALSARMARAIVNIAVPNHIHRDVIDPCCGIGTVLLEASAMGINISGRELNPLAAQGARENLAYYDYEVPVVLGDMREITDDYDVAIIDMPYNVCSVLPHEDKRSMMVHASKFAKQAVIISSEALQDELLQAGFKIIDHCKVSKGHFQRDVWCCES